MKTNGYEDKITVLKGKMEEIVLPVDKVDIIISEWMGYFLLYESMLDTVLYARDKYLKPDGIMLPDHVSLYLAAIEDAQYHQSKFAFWDSVYGVNMQCIRQAAMGEPVVDTVESRQVVSNECRVLDLDLYTATVEDLSFSHKYSVKMKKSQTVHALVGWFDATFGKLKEPIKLTTSPFFQPTHWKQTIFYLSEPINAGSGCELSGSIAVRRSKTNFRDLDIKLSYHYSDKELTIANVQMYKLR
ncbi:MAG: hypothetical protein P4M11_00100 [Candidatus Pacebacteria bacterium]|nr:hypothetical protein [Candidatus Paceibacterota bacterium]